MKDLQELLNCFIKDPENPDINFKLANYYHNIEQTATAVSYYIRTAERTSDKKLSYACLLACAYCFDKQGCRSISVKGMLQNAISLMPERPEGYFLLSRFYEREEEYQDSYLISSIGMKLTSNYNIKLDKLPIDVGYPGTWGIIFEKAVSSWHCGLTDESKQLFYDLKNNYYNSLDYIHQISVDDNIERLF